MNNTVQKTIEILKLLASTEEGLTITQIAQKLDLVKTTVFNIIHTLEAQDFLEVDTKTKVYRIGTEAFHIGSAFLKNKSLDSVARPVLFDLRNKTNETVYLAGRRGQSDFIYLMKFRSNSIYQTIFSAGDVRHLLTTALGKAILAALPDEVALACVTEEMYKTSSIPSIYDPDSLKAYLHIVRQDGYATDMTDENSAIACPVAAPILNNEGKVLGAISIVIMENPTSETRIKELGNCVNEAATEISHGLGFAGTDLFYQGR